MSTKSMDIQVPMLSEDQIHRYSRNILLPGVGGEGQEKLLGSKVLVIGAGGLGSPAALYLAAAGIGTLGIADSDNVDISNLQRQILHATADIGRHKTESARDRVSGLNPDVGVRVHAVRVDEKNIAEMIGGYDFVIDGSDNFPTKYLINDACVLGGKPFSHGGILRFFGQSITFAPGHACLRCVFPSPPPPGASPTCSEAGVLGAVAGMLGSVQAAEAIKFLLGLDGILLDTLFHFDVLSMHFGTIRCKRNASCPVCGKKPLIRSLIRERGPECAEG